MYHKIGLLRLKTENDVENRQSCCLKVFLNSINFVGESKGYPDQHDKNIYWHRNEFILSSCKKEFKVKIYERYF